MSTKLAKIIADFQTQLSTKMEIGATTATLQSATDDDNVALPAGRYFFTIDGDNSQKEHISCSLSSTALTSIKSVSRQGVETSGCVRVHRVGASVVITDFAHILELNNLLNGTDMLDASTPLEYDGTATIGTDNQLATVKYVAETITGFTGTATASVAGTTKLSLNPASVGNPIAVGDNDTRVPTQAENDALVGNNTDIVVGTGNKYVTQTGLQKAAEIYAASATGNDSYAITLSPVPTSYSNGMVFRFKADVGNTGPATLNVNSLGAIAITKLNDQALVTGDIEANQIVEVIYNSTGPTFQMQSQLASPAVTVDIQTFLASGTWTKPLGALKVLVQSWGGGGSGGKGNDANGGGGGGAEYRETWHNASDLTSTVAVTIGAGGALKSSAGAGNAGADTTFGAYATAKGGLGGGSAAGSDVAGGDGGYPFAAINGLYGAGVSAAVGQSGLYSAAGGGTNNGSNSDFNGGNSYYGGAGGGGSNKTGAAPASGGTSTYGGNGGAGAVNGNAVAGSVPGGGGGANSGTGNSGAGGDGKMIVTTFF